MCAGLFVYSLQQSCRVDAITSFLRMNKLRPRILNWDTEPARTQTRVFSSPGTSDIKARALNHKAGLPC